MRPTRRPAAALAALMLLLAAGPRPALAWGRVGHRAAALAAESRLSPAARAAVRDLLDPNETLADASTWPDEHRRELPETGPWHYVNVPITEARYDAKFCPEAGCVVGKIADMRKILADPNASKDEKRQALRFLVHLVQDLHQPVHVGDRKDRGGNDLQLRFFDQGTNLHRLWDSGLIEKHSTDAAAWARELAEQITPENASAWAGGTVEDWANESLAAARVAYLIPGSQNPLKAGTKLGQQYHDEELPVARRRLAQSAVRLAAILNDLYR